MTAIIMAVCTLLFQKLYTVLGKNSPQVKGLKNNMKFTRAAC